MAEMDENLEVKPETRQERMWAMLCHFGTLAGFPILFAHIIAPLIIWLIKKEEFPFVDDQGKEALNFQISMTIYYLIALVLTLIYIGALLLAGLVIFDMIIVIIASVKANNGERFRYPLRIRFIK